MRHRLAAGLLLLSVLLSSCFVNTKRVYFQHETLLTSRHFDINNDSIRFSFHIRPLSLTAVVPGMIFKRDREKARLDYALYGKGISGREYQVTLKEIRIFNDTALIGKSQSPDLLLERVLHRVPRDIISPYYESDPVLKIKKARKAKLSMHLAFEIKNRNGLTETFIFDVPLQRIEQKSVTLLNVFK